MAQFDVHRNRSAARTGVPFLLVVQSQRFDASGRRVVVPLLPADKLRATEPSFTPAFLVEQRSVVLHPLQIVSIPADHLGEKVCSLADDGDRIIAALDLPISRAWG
ncbi:CcdB family protein [Azospirillum agricola]|uniref:CcdB family protein n=1 Tax=Azospirillum agricola TaxID=1720247 RepID=UPI000A0F1D8D|nr:CcdB family protein [Azospirillum agricola]SMH31155.1 toxin CcdB [Azospirillum lipoferum]